MSFARHTKFSPIVKYKSIVNKSFYAARLKIVYDQHGEDTLRLGVLDKDGSKENESVIEHLEYIGGYIYQHDCYKIFDDFFLKCNLFHAVYDSTGETLQGSLFGSAYGGALAPQALPASNVEVDVPVSLREFYLGSVKVVAYTRQVLALDGHTIKEEGESCVKTIVIKPGWTLGQKLRFK